MPETPDFEKIARLLRSAVSLVGDDQKDVATGAIEAELKKVWNARGAADIAKLDTDLTSMMGVQMAGPYVKNLDRALRTLDR